jgi:hypothetical protein
MYCAHKNVVVWGLLVLATIGTILLAQPAAAAVSGYNAFLQESEGKAFIPMKPRTSGVLGDLLNNNRIVGASGDKVTLTGKGDSRTGSLSYDLFFDLSANMGPTGEPILYGDGEEVDVSTMDLFLDLFDIDFVPVSGRTYDYYEMLTLTFIRDGDGASPFLTIDMNNFAAYGPAGLTKTNDEQVTYVISLQEDLGLSAGDFEQIMEDMSFTIMVTATSYIERTKRGSGRYITAPEYLGDYSAGSVDNGFSGPDGLPVNALTFDMIPEPMTLTLLGAGSFVLLWRRKARAA